MSDSPNPATAMNVKLPSRGWFNVGLIGLGHFSSDFYCNVLPILLPAFAVRFGLSYSQCGALFMVFQIAANFIQPPIGIAADRYRINALMPLSILAGGISACLVCLMPSLTTLFALTLFSGICASGFHPIAGGIVPKVSPPGHEVLATSVFIVGGNIGFAVAPLAVAWYIELAGEEALPLMASLALATAALMFVRRMHISAPRGQVKSVNLHELLHNRPFLWFTLSMALRSWCYCAMVLYLALLLDAEGIGSVQSASAIMCMLLGTACGSILVGALSLRIGIKALIASTYALSAVSLAVFLYKPDLSALSYLALFILGAALYGSTPPAIIWSQRLLSDSAAFAASMILGFTFGAGYITSILTGIIADYLDLRAALALTCLPGLLLALAIILRLKEPAGREHALS
ncbi:MAG: MFS transporter [Succinivibrio sp.]|nr:MFS transporter [Succinivibrio sp.]